MNMNIDAVSAVNIAQIALSTTQADFTKFVESLASGKFSDVNPSDLYVSDNISVDTMSRYAAIENAQQGVNLTGMADSVLSDVSKSVSRIKELSIKAANDTYSDSQRLAIQSEIDELAAGISQTLESVNYNGKEILNVVNSDNPETVENINFQIGSGTTEDSVVSYNPNMKMPDDISFDVSSSENARASMALADDMLDSISSKRSEIAAVQSGLISSVETNMTAIVNNQSAYSRISDTDYASAMIDLLKSKISQETLITVLKSNFQTQSNVMDLISGSGQ